MLLPIRPDISHPRIDPGLRGVGFDLFAQNSRPAHAFFLLAAREGDGPPAFAVRQVAPSHALPAPLYPEQFSEKKEVVTEEPWREVVCPNVFLPVPAHLTGELAVFEELRAG